MVIFDLSVEKQQIYGADRISLAADANDTIAFRFHFDRHWRLFDSKAAIFKNVDSEYYIIEIKDNRVKVPWEVLKKDRDIEMSVIGFDNEEVITAKQVTISVNSSLLPEDYKTYSASETLFDRFKKECTAQAFLDYEEEIIQLKSSYEDTIVKLGAKINDANEATKAMENEKNKEIQKINNEHSAEIKAKNEEMAKINTELATASEKAEKWDLIDIALQGKTTNSQPLWGTATEEFSLPFLNTKNMIQFSNSYISPLLESVGFDCTSATNLSESFANKHGLKQIRLVNCENVTSFKNCFISCDSIKEVSIDSMPMCTTVENMFSKCSSLEKLYINNTQRVQTFLYTFENCYSLREVCGVIDMSMANNISSVFTGCANLLNVNFKEETIRKSIDMKPCAYLSKESMLSLFKGLCSEVAATVTVSKHAFDCNFSTDEEKEEMYDLINDKGWAVSLN